MIKNLAYDIADQMMITLTNIELVNGLHLGCRDAHLLKITAQGKTVSTLILQEDAVISPDEIGNIKNAQKIHNAITQLKMMLE
jgi:hypothetical protein